MRITIASRKSDLARIQAHAVGNALIKAHPHIKLEYNFRESLGDKNLTDPLWKMPEKGVFTEDFVDDLKKSRVDMVIHSWKDLPIEEREGTSIVATLPRADQRDLFLFRKDRKKQRVLNVLSSSPRRAYNLEPFLKEALPFDLDHVNFESVRGNVPTRIQKLFDSDSDGLVVAKAALDRLLLAEAEEFFPVQKKIRQYLEKTLMMITPLERNPTAAAQGALAVEIRNDRDDLRKLLESINCPSTFKSVVREREKLKIFGGGCHQKVGVSVRTFDYGHVMYIRALTDKTGAVDDVEFEPAVRVPKTTADKIFPTSGTDVKFFERTPLDVKIPRGPLWIAKADALPESVAIDVTQLVWTSGFETWKKLARRGIWVTGCSESLGEDYGLGLSPLFGTVEFTKLSHEDAPYTPSSKNLATYKLLPKQNLPDLSEKTHFFWTSGSSFKLALEKFPMIKDAYNACGPGNTYKVVAELARHVLIYPSLELWKRDVLE